MENISTPRDQHDASLAQIHVKLKKYFVRKIIIKVELDKNVLIADVLIRAKNCSSPRKCWANRDLAHDSAALGHFHFHREPSIFRKILTAGATVSFNFSLLLPTQNPKDCH